MCILYSNMPPHFSQTEVTGFERWLTGQSKGKHVYGRNKVEEFYVLELDGKVIACTGLYMPEMEQRANLVWGMVDKKYQHQGIGKELFAFSIQRVRELSPSDLITLDTNQHAYPFFKKLGFKVGNVQKAVAHDGCHKYGMYMK